MGDGISSPGYLFPVQEASAVVSLSFKKQSTSAKLIEMLGKKNDNSSGSLAYNFQRKTVMNVYPQEQCLIKLLALKALWDRFLSSLSTVISRNECNE